MMTLWRRLRNMNTYEVYGAVAERVDGCDTDELMRHQLRGWYADLLAHGPEDALICSELAVALEGAGEFCWRATLPTTVERVFDVSVSGLPCAIPIVKEAVVNPFMPPVAVVSGSHLTVFPFERKPDLVRVRVVTRPTDGTYLFDDCILRQLFPFVPKEI